MVQLWENWKRNLKQIDILNTEVSPLTKRAQENLHQLWVEKLLQEEPSQNLGAPNMQHINIFSIWIELLINALLINRLT